MSNVQVCVERYKAQEEQQVRLKRLHSMIGTSRLAGAAFGLALVWLAEAYWPTLTWPTVAVLGAAFVCSSVALSRLESRIEYAGLAKLHYGRLVHGTIRTEQTDGGPEKLAKGLSIGDDHPFALDVDLLEPGGLLDKISLGSTIGGVRRLAELLTTPAGMRTIDGRQAAVRELAPMLDLRERFHVEGARNGRLIRTDSILEWAAKEVQTIPAWIRPTAATLSLAVLASIAALAFSASSVTLAIVAATVAGCLWFRRRASSLLDIPGIEAEAFHEDFSRLLVLVRILEAQTFEAARMQEITEPLRTRGRSASKALEEFRRVLTLHEARRNQIVAILGPAVLYGTHVSLMVEDWRAKHAASLPGWLGAVAEFEAFSSLGGFAFVHEDYAFPELSDEGPMLHARELGHPLLGPSAVGNDITLDRRQPILVISGANMAGKSTLLRTIGVSVSLAYAGAPVQAASMAMSDLVLVTSIRVADSLQRGESRFAAELQRIRLMLDSVRRGRPTLVLIDELFAGTNSYDRHAGAAALGEHLLEFESALAILSTHDRNVTRWAEQRSERVANMHFRDVFGDGEMKFDYKLHDGPATQGNAVELMRMAGIPVQDGLQTLPQ